MILLPLKLGDTIPGSYEPCLFTVESAAEFVKMLKQCSEFYCFMLDLRHYAVHDGDKVAAAYQSSEKMLYKREKRVSSCVQ